MQVPGPTMIVTEGQPVTINLTNNLPTAAGNTSILFPGFNVTTSCSAATPVGQQGLLTCEAVLRADRAPIRSPPRRRARTRITAERRATFRSRWGSTARSLCCRQTPPANCANGTSTTNLYTKPDYGTSAHIDRISGAGLPPVSPLPTTTPRAATTGNTCSSGPRWIPEFINRQRRKFRPRWAARRDHGLQPRRADRALPSGLLPDQRAFHARPDGPQLCIRISAPALQRQSRTCIRANSR